MIKKRRQHRACEYCGAALDPGEKCECRKIRTYEEQHGLRLLHDTKNAGAHSGEHRQPKKCLLKNKTP